MVSPQFFGHWCVSFSPPTPHEPQWAKTGPASARLMPAARSRNENFFIIITPSYRRSEASAWKNHSLMLAACEELEARPKPSRGRKPALRPDLHNQVAGSIQIGEDQARSWRVLYQSGRGGDPARRASQVDQRQVGFSSTRT